MSGITLNTVFNNSLLSSANSLGKQLSEMPTMLGWFQADDNHISLEGTEIVSFADRSNKNGAFLQVSSLSRAELVNSELQQYSAAQFVDESTTGGSADVYRLNGANFNTNAAYSVVAVFKVTNPSDGDTVFAKFSSGTDRVVISINNPGNEVRFYHGGSEVLSHPIEPNKWCFLIASFDGNNLHLYADGIKYEEKPAIGTGGSGNVNIGALGDSGSQAFNGFISDIMIFSSDVVSNSNDLDVITGYMDLVYGL